ncbi:MAG TPA: hypothetical protein VJ839_08440 [Candidatus Limnocylindria bacterium]|nr:hypothetical protein [Candidatus Limnocylindria bacterium]
MRTISTWGSIAIVVLMCACTAGTIAQPDTGDLPVAPDSARVDLAMPAFSNPTEITNPLFPVSDQASVLLVGEVDGEPFRTEVTLLPETRIIDWEGLRVEVLISQYVAYLGGRLHEVAYDFYAQADDGSVWYFGEDVFNFADGAITNTHGTWLAGRDGPAAMIMPADLQVGQVYRPENIPGFVFEEVTVQTVDQTLDGPFGPISGGIEVHELHMDGATEDKQFAPDYGEFYTSDGVDTEALAMAVPTDAASGPVPEGPATIAAAAASIFDAALTGDLGASAERVQEILLAWTHTDAADVPILVLPIMTDALDRLAVAVDAGNAEAAAQAAIDVGQSAADLQLRHRPVTEVDRARFDLWLAQLQLDAAAEDSDAVNGDALALDYTRERFVHALDANAAADLNLAMEDLHVAVADGDLAAVAAIAQRMMNAP